MIYPKRKNCEDDHATLYLRIFFEHEQTDKSLGITIPVTAWDPVTHAATSNPELNTRIIVKAESYKQKILSAYYLMRNSSESLCMKDILEVAIENKVPKMLSFLQCFQDSIERMQELIGIEVTYANIQKHKVCLTHLRTFAKEQYRWNDFPFSKIDHKFVSSFF